MKDIKKDDLRWDKGDYTVKCPEKMTYIETIEAMCDYYGTFCGRWHDNKFWAKTKAEIITMSEEDAKRKVFEIENNADDSLNEWRRYYS